MSEPREKWCPVCGRRIEWRKKWERDWDSIRFCGNACKKRGLNDTDRALERELLSLLQKRGRAASVCPSEIAKAVGGEEEDRWRPLMEPARMAARRLVVQGAAEITQKNKVADASTARGPIRVRLTRG